MGALTNLLLAIVAYNFPVGIAIAFSLCFPLTFGLKNLPRLRRPLSSYQREGLVAAFIVTALTAFFCIGILGTLFLQHVQTIPWAIPFLLAVVVSAFNTINLHQYLIVTRGGSSSSSVYNGGSSSGDGSSYSGGDSGGGFGGGSSEGGGAGGSW